MEDSAYHYGLAVAVMKRFEIGDLALPVDDLRRHLLLHYEDRYHLHPGKYEELVRDVFRDAGRDLRVMGRSVYSADDGIDLIVLDSNGEQSEGIQIKRHRNKIEVARIREFAGALVLNGITKGVFVTTSSFTKGATRTADRYMKRGLSIELVDALSFYERLRIQTRARYLEADDVTAPFIPVLNQGSLFTGPDFHFIDD